MTSPWRLLVVAAIGLTAAACSGPSDSQISPEMAAAYDYRIKHPIEVEQRLAVVRLNAEPGASGAISAEDLRRIKGTAADYIRRASGPLQVSVGAVHAADPRARAWAQAIAQQLLAAGLKRGELRLELVLKEPTVAPGTAMLRYATTVAEVPECYDWSAGPRNAPSANFGCSVQRNLGQMIANPRDLGEPAMGEGMPAARGDAAIDRMNQGTATWSVPLPLQADTKSGGQ